MALRMARISARVKYQVRGTSPAMPTGVPDSDQGSGASCPRRGIVAEFSNATVVKNCPG